ncbi:MAG: hypothetical protein SYR96_08635 [Actinomycetota bacterium]|nr:hypothetical protein [Actinomycetota bacterium]
MINPFSDDSTLTGSPRTPSRPRLEGGFAAGRDAGLPTIPGVPQEQAVGGLDRYATPAS